MAAPRRGDLWLVDFGEPIGHEQGYRRPAVVVSSDRLNSSAAGLAIVVPATTTRRRVPSHIEIEPTKSNGLDRTSYAKVEDLKSVSVDRLVRRLGTLELPQLQQIVNVERFLLEL